MKRPGVAGARARVEWRPPSSRFIKLGREVARGEGLEAELI